MLFIRHCQFTVGWFALYTESPLDCIKRQPHPIKGALLGCFSHFYEISQCLKEMIRMLELLILISWFHVLERIQCFTKLTPKWFVQYFEVENCFGKWHPKLIQTSSRHFRTVTLCEIACGLWNVDVYFEDYERSENAD